MLNLTIILKIGAIGVITLILNQILESNGKKQYAVLIDMVSLVTILLLVVSLISDLFNALQTIFMF